MFEEAKLIEALFAGATTEGERVAAGNRCLPNAGGPVVRKKKNKLHGRWRIEDMSGWDADYFDMDQPARLELDRDGLGYMVFGLVEGQVDARYTTRDERPIVEFSWLGQDECDPASGRGWAALVDDDTIEGEIFIHLGDGSTFRARRW